MLELRSLSCRFGDFALQDISLRLENGQYWVLLGPSGCGKTVLLQTIAGFHTKVAGQIILAGRDATHEVPETRGLGMVFQQAALFEHITVTDNIAYGLDVRRVSSGERKQRVDRIVHALQLGPVLTRPVATLSGGEAQRVSIARALVIEPSLLLLDEPLSMLDHNARIELREQLAWIHRQLGTTTLHVTHSRKEARALGDYVAVMVGGCVIQAGKTDDVFKKPYCPFVGSFLGFDSPDEVMSLPCAKDCPASGFCGEAKG